MNAPRPYQVCLYVGTAKPVIEDVVVVDLTPATREPGLVLECLVASGLTPADLRSRVLFATDTGADPEVSAKAVMVYAALLGFAGRRIDVSVGDDLIASADLDAMARALPDAGRPDMIPDAVQVGAVLHPELPSVGIRGILDPEEVTLVRYARRVRFVASDSPLIALTQLLVVAGIRQRNGVDRLPFLCVGDEPAISAPDGDMPAEPVGICLDTLRREAVDVRRSLRPDNRTSLADKVDLTYRQRQLLSAAAQPVEVTLVRLGASASADGELWHCPRPERHNNGDANPSMKVVRGKTRCFRCDPERVDSLRLAMDARSWTADEAAVWLLSPHDVVIPASELSSSDPDVTTPV